MRVALLFGEKLLDVSDDHDIGSRRKHRMRVALLFGEKLLDVSDDHTARFDRELAAQIGPAVRLHWRLAQQVLAARKGAEELVIQVIAVGQHDDGGVFHGLLADDAPGIEDHSQTFARPLGMPDHTDTPVAGVAAGLLARFVAP